MISDASTEIDMSTFDLDPDSTLKDSKLQHFVSVIILTTHLRNLGLRRPASQTHERNSFVKTETEARSFEGLNQNAHGTNCTW